jgi:transcriptional regulator with XRE-family HTH domain
MQSKGRKPLRPGQPAGAALWKDLGSRIVEFRQRRGWKQSELARRLGMSPDRLSKLERGDRPPRITELFQLAAVFEISLDELAFGAPVAREPAVSIADPEALAFLGGRVLEAVAASYDLLRRTRPESAP